MADDKQAAERRLDNLLMMVSRYRGYLEQYRNRGDTSGVAKCERLLDFHYSRIRKLCTEHGLDLPNDIPAERF